MTPEQYLANVAEILADDRVIVTVDPEPHFNDDGDSEPVAVIYAKLSTGEWYYRAWTLLGAESHLVGQGRAF